jgi:hypothetical protein
MIKRSTDEIPPSSSDTEDSTETRHPRTIPIRQYRLLSPLDWGEDCEAELRRMTDLAMMGTSA